MLYSSFFNLKVIIYFDSFDIYVSIINFSLVLISKGLS